MTETITADSWIWVLVGQTNQKEQFLGLYDEAADVSYIPVFLEKDDATEWMLRFWPGQKREYEAQAIRYGELLRQKADPDYALYLMNGEGELLKELKSQ